MEQYICIATSDNGSNRKVASLFLALFQQIFFFPMSTKALLALKSHVEKRKAELQAQNRTKKWKRLGDEWKEEDKQQQQQQPEPLKETHSEVESPEEQRTIQDTHREPPLAKTEVRKKDSATTKIILFESRLVR